MSTLAGNLPVSISLFRMHGTIHLHTLIIDHKLDAKMRNGGKMNKKLRKFC